MRSHDCISSDRNRELSACVCTNSIVFDDEALKETIDVLFRVLKQYLASLK